MQSAFGVVIGSPLSSPNVVGRNAAVAGQSIARFERRRHRAGAVLARVEVRPRVPSVVGIHVRHEHLGHVALIEHRAQPGPVLPARDGDHGADTAIDARMEAPVAPGNLVSVDDHVRALRLRHHRRLARRAQRARCRLGEILLAIRDRYHAGVSDAQHLALAQVDDRIETLDRPAPHVRRRAAQVIAADLDDAFARMLRDGEVPGGDR